MREPLRIPRVEAELRELVKSVSKKTVLLSRQASPFSNGRVEEDLLTHAGRSVYDFDDALMHTPTSSRERIWSKRRVWSRSVAAADIVIAGNDYLAAEAAHYSNNVLVIPSCVEPKTYTQKVEYEIAKDPVAVWLGSPSTEQYLQSIAGPLLSMNKAKGLRLLVISAGQATLGPLDDMIDRKNWSNLAFQNDLVGADFGIMPLDDTPWSRGKCAYKLLQYAAAGLPIVGSPVGVNDLVLRQADGFSASTLRDWEESIEALINEPAGRRALRGRNGRCAVETNYSFAAWAPVWHEAMGLASA
ncbi:glycosyltransferase [Cryobacterium sp. TMT1-3]|uniref:glycosyltransferase n=1 Tax=Cryobacterium sp. TMT1-3 TaxID=1259237 RepID=UPI00141B02CA|nr:glycosyltransferase [Cryobacterium sp. TMT1-3]